jgi:hypothetical protein
MSKSGTFVKIKDSMNAKICISLDLEEAAEILMGRG